VTSGTSRDATSPSSAGGRTVTTNACPRSPPSSYGSNRTSLSRAGPASPCSRRRRPRCPSSWRPPATWWRWARNCPGYGVDLGLVKRTGTRLSLELVEVPVHSAGELDDAFALMLRRRVDGVTMLSDSMLVANMRRLGELSTAKHLPGAGSDEYAQGGGLLAEGAVLRRQDPQGREACGHPRRAGLEVRAGHQLADGQDSRVAAPAIVAAPGGSGHRVARSPAWSPTWPEPRPGSSPAPASTADSPRSRAS